MTTQDASVAEPAPAQRGPTVSVLVSSYNYEAYVVDAVRSALAQARIPRAVSLAASPCPMLAATTTSKPSSGCQPSPPQTDSICPGSSSSDEKPASRSVSRTKKCRHFPA